MQKVERKNHHNSKNRRLLWLAAAFVLLAGSVTAAVLLSRKPEEVPAQEPHWGLLIDRETDDMISVTVKRRGEEAWTLVRTEDGGLAPEGGDWTVSELQGNMLREAMTQLRYEEILTEDPAVWQEKPEDFGLAEAAVTVTAGYSDGTRTTVRVGNDTGLEEGWHYLTVEGDDRLYAVSSGIAEDLNIEFALLHPVPRPEIYASLLDRITVQDGMQTIAEWALQGKITDRDAGSNWAVTVPFYAPADEETIQNLKKSAENIRLGVYKAPATDENLTAYGLDVPRRVLFFHMAEGSTGTVSDAGVYDVTEHAEQTVWLSVGSEAGEMASYVRFGDEIFTVSTFTLSAFTDPKPMDTAARYPVLTPLESLESLTVEADGKTRIYRLEETEGDGEDTPQRRCLLNGEEIAYTAFEAAYNRLLTVTYSGVLPEGAVWKEGYKKYTFRTLSGGTHTVILSDWDGMHDAVTIDGSTLFYLIRGGMTELPDQEGSD